MTRDFSPLTVIVASAGGLGNQMFHYACGRALAWRTGRRFLFDAASLRQDPLRKYALAAFPLKAEFVGGLRAGLLRSTTVPFLSRFALAWLSLRGLRFVRDAQRGFDPSIFETSGNLVLRGYWQSERYFDCVAEQIRSDFAFPPPQHSIAARWLREIDSYESIAAHVRRGDYVANPQTNAVHGTLSPEYYAAASGSVVRRVANPRVFVFSDDPDWAQQNLTFPGPWCVVRTTDCPDCEDMRPMSAFLHLVIANSSFSRWAAWLCRNPNQIVVAPKQWFRNYHADTKDLLPSTWETL